METMGPFANFDFPSTVDEMNYSFLSNGFDEYYLDLETSQEPHQQQPQSRANSNANSQNQSYTQQQDQPAYYSNHSFQHTLPVADAFVPGASTCDQMLVEHYDIMGTGYRAFQDAEILSFDDMLNTANGAPFNANYAQPVCPPSPISSSATESTDQETTDVDASTASQKQKACTLPLKAKTTPASAVPVMQGKKLPHLHQQSAQEQLRQPQAQRQAPLLQNDSQSKSRRQQTPPQPLQVSTAMPTPSMDSPILPQADMPNLNLGDNLVSSIDFQVSTPLTSPSSGNSPPESASNVAPMTPAEIMKLSKTRQAPAESSKEQQKPFQLQQQPRKSEQEPRSKQKKQQRVATNPPDTKHQNLNAQLVVRQGTNSAGSQQVIVISPVVSPCKGIVNGVASSRRKGTMPTSVSPLGLGPSSRSPPGLQPLISPSLKPKGIAGGAAEQLAQKSNYQNILEGNAQAMGITYSSDLQSSLESRRTTHKAAEQKRRDSLKQSFDDLKKVVPGKLSQSGGNSDNGVEANGRVGTAHGNDEKNISKLILLKRARDHIVELQQEVKDKDETIKRLTEELEALRGPKRMKCSHARKLEPVKEDDEEMSKKVHV